MENNLPPQTEEAQQPEMSLGSRLMNVYAAPGEVFDYVKASKSCTVNWLVPVLMACLVGVISVLVMFSQPAIQQQMRDLQAQRFQKMVEEGKMTESQAEEMQETMGNVFGTTLVKVSGSIGAVFATFGWLFFLALLLWLLGAKLFKGQFSYIKAVEVTGLTGMIGVLGGIVKTLLTVATGNMLAGVNPALFISELNPANKSHLLLASLDVVTIWYIVVLAIGLSKLSGASFAKACLWLFCPWLIIKAGLIMAGAGGSMM